MSKSNKIYEKLGNYIINNNFTFNLDEQPMVQDFEDVIGENIGLVAKCVPNIEKFFPSKGKIVREYFDPDDENYDGKKIDYVKEDDLWTDEDCEWLYCLAYDGHIVKLGMTITSLKSRYASYSCGTGRAMKKGSCSTTNFIISECNAHAIMNNMEVEIYGISVSKKIEKETRFGVTKECIYSTIRDKETMITEAFKNAYGHKPVLCIQEGK